MFPMVPACHLVQEVVCPYSSLIKPAIALYKSHILNLSQTLQIWVVDSMSATDRIRQTTIW